MFDQPFVVPGILLILVSVPLIFGLIPPNRFYGIRTSKTLEKDGYWYPANRYGGWAILLCGVSYLVVAYVLPASTGRGTRTESWLVHLCVFLLPLVISLLLIRRYVNRL